MKCECGTVYSVTIIADDLRRKGRIAAGFDRDTFTAIYEIARNFLNSPYVPERYLNNLEAYATKELLLKYGDVSKLHGRVWWDIEQEAFIGESQLYDEYLVMRHDGLTFEDYILGCQTAENGTLELVREG